jgi:hypothetical protein
MALTSPGVQVTVIDESFYTPSEAGTTAMLVVATAQNKINAAGTATAIGTTLANVGQVYRITSQRELLDTFGVPFFEKTVTNTPIHGSERNEYGLLSAYSLLGVTNSVFVVRADVDLDQLEPAIAEPGAEPDDGKWWVNTAASAFGVQTWNGTTASGIGQRFSAATPHVLTNDDTSKVSSNVPRTSFGSIGDYAMVIETGTVNKEFAKLYYKSAGNGGETFYISGTIVDAGEWVLVGSNKWVASHPTVISGRAVTDASLNAGDTFKINGTVVTVQGAATVAALASAINGTIEGVTARAISGTLYLYSDGTASASEDSTLNGAIQIETGTGSILNSTTGIGITATTYYPPSVFQGPHTQVPSFRNTDTYPRPTGSIWIKTTEPNQGARWRVSRWSSALKVWEPFDAPIYRNTHQAIYYLDRSGGGVNIPTGSIMVQFNAS